MKTLRVLAICAAAALWSGAAYADAVPPPPDNCLDGTEGATCHGGEYCAPAGCAQDADCAAGKVCQDRQLCLGTIDCTGGFSDPDAGPFLSDRITGTCAGGVGCDAPAMCTTLKVCVASVVTTGGGTAGGSADGEDMAVSGCGCSIPAGGRGIAAGMAALSLGGALLAARRQRPRQRRR
jgi:hypothetical protein